MDFPHFEEIENLKKKVIIARAVCHFITQPAIYRAMVYFLLCQAVAFTAQLQVNSFDSVTSLSHVKVYM